MFGGEGCIPMKDSITVILVVSLFLVIYTPASNAAIELYGVARISLDVVDDSIERNIGVSSNLSYIGVKGGHKINEYITGVYKFEMGFDGTGETGDLSTRWRYIGGQGKFGRVLVGIVPTPFRAAGRAFDAFPETIGEYRGVLGLSAAGAPKYDRWASNSVFYASPKMNGSQLTATYSSAFGGASTPSGADDNDDALFGATLDYTKGKFLLRAVYEEHEIDSSDGLRMILGYTYGKTTLGVAYETIDAGKGNKLTRDAYGFNVAHPVGGLTYKLQMLIASDYDGKSESGAVNTTVGIFKKMDKFFTVYVAYGATDNDRNAKYTIASVGHKGDIIKAINAGDEVKAISVGAAYIFN